MLSHDAHVTCVCDVDFLFPGRLNRTASISHRLCVCVFCCCCFVCFWGFFGMGERKTQQDWPSSVSLLRLTLWKCLFEIYNATLTFQNIWREICGNENILRQREENVSKINYVSGIQEKLTPCRILCSFCGSKISWGAVFLVVRFCLQVVLFARCCEICSSKVSDFCIFCLFLSKTTLTVVEADLLVDSMWIRKNLLE